MEDTNKLSRRSLLVTGVATSFSLAGCAGDSSSGTPEQTGDSEGTPGDTVEDPAPTVAEFDYPSGASQTGISAGTLYSTHESTLMNTDSASLNRQVDKTTDRFEESIDATTKVSSDSILRTRTDTEDGNTTSHWSPAGEQTTYSRWQSGASERYRIATRTPDMTGVFRLRELETLLTSAEWGEASGVVEVGNDEYAVTYESTGVADEEELSQLIFADEITEFEATLTLTASGYLTEYTYDLTGETGRGTRRHDTTQTIDDLGATDLQPPEWEDTARADGVQFESTLVNDRSAVKIEMVNGGKVPSRARVAISIPEQRAETTLSEEITVGETRYLSISETGDLRVSEDVPASGQQLGESYVLASIRYRGFALLEKEFTP